MAFMKYAKASVITPFVTKDQWRNIRVAGRTFATHRPDGTGFSKSAAIDLAANLADRAAALFEQPFNPKDYLLTHATIVASVDTYAPKGTKLGKVHEDGFRINRKYADYRVKPGCEKYINNNRDCWSRGVIGKSYETFVGGHNFVEHVQIEDLSKGRIIDAVGRDIGDSVYVDILIATERKHRDLVAAIQNGRMGTLSMGCFLPGTQVTMADGRRIAIEDVQPGDMVLTHKGRAREVLNKQIRGGKWDTRRIQAVGVPDTIEATDNHPFFVFRQPDTCACGCGEALPEYKNNRKNATRGLKRRFLRGHDKRILNPNNTYSMKEYKERKARLDAIQAGEGQWVRADELRVGDFLCFPRSQVEGTEVSTGRARLLGYFLAEGSFQKYKGELSAVEFSFSMDEKDTFVAEVMSLLKREFPGKEPTVNDHPHRNVCSVRFGDREAAQWFFAHGGEYSNHKVISPEVLSWSVEAHKHLIGAWINGDGHLHGIHGHTSGTTTSYDLVCQMHMLMASCGWFARMEAKIGARCVEVREIVNGGFARDETTGKLPHYNLIVGKTQAIEMAPYTAKAATTTAFESQGPRVRDDVVMFPITSIEEATHDGWVHNMEVEEDNSYVVSGTCSHNCTVDGTICTKCGHWASDETEMCAHVKYEKGNTFYDKEGRKHIVAELCGHENLNPTGGVYFIEASWVEIPAFTGAVLRNVLQPSVEIQRKARRILSSPPTQWSKGARKKAASVIIPVGSVSARATRLAELRAEQKREDRLAQFAQSEDDVMPDEAGGEGEGETTPPLLQGLEDELTQAVLEKVKKRLQESIQGPDTSPGPEQSTSTNENLQQVAAGHKVAARLYRGMLDSIARTASSDVQVVDRVADFHQGIGLSVPVSVYRTALKVGALHGYNSKQEFLTSCRKTLGRNLTKVEAGALIRLGRLLSLIG